MHCPEKMKQFSNSNNNHAYVSNNYVQLDDSTNCIY